ncbi:secondary thiamine-phosphate synthase enzyme [Orenia metallireducens]|uniref:Secondary thiamine-phosphate synthase enzyme n=1 Tax=Orenia metallireducens TaxID=1413210 RepID=A0A285GBN8_9FIRM|nr:secondary thiamine-phosphate synthase enzyme YjbQ [Orenia metallireducens]SNY20733.1 secondary thiamine-phosphate synthase enzyme [Orenia metallireducens]
MFTEFDLKTDNHSELIDMTDKIQEIVTGSKVENGICLIFIPHTTAGVTINENADPTVKDDILYKLKDLIPWEDNYQHLEGNSAAHLKASLFGNSEQIIIKDGRLLLGTWQGIYFAEFDGPRRRRVQVKIVTSNE